MTKMPFFECHKGAVGSNRVGIPPHFRAGRLIYSRYHDWAFMTKVRHLFWSFWWVKR